ncbi:AAA family ATPase [Oerskovia flava]|uniref:AAA family ATPase n=1 Tax=Oerskovia flava TaxID=2986422 RepID=UPI00223EED99|nr:AAA family ATPase [Oerskovia sp. JB1-3-2]
MSGGQGAHPGGTGAAGLTAALDALVVAGATAGLAEDAVRDEGSRLAAAVAESATGAAHEWLAAVGHESAAFGAFFTAAASARRWRSAPTDLLTGLVSSGSPAAVDYAAALADVVSAACDLGSPSMSVLASASATAAVQRDAAAPRRPAPSVAPTGTRPTGAPAHVDLSSLDLSLGGSSFGTAPSGTFPSGTGRAGEVGDLPSVEAILDALRPAPTPTGDAAGSTQGAAGTSAEVEAETDTEAAAEPDPRTLEEMLGELDALIGLDRVKHEIRQQTEMLRIEGLRTAAGLTRPTMTRHLVFLGNPGTGKTTVARLVAGIYRALGLLAKGHLVEVDRSELVAGYLGQTAVKTSEVVATALGGVLFIDEAYGLAEDQYGAEAINTLVKDMEDHREDLVVIVAGYPGPMGEFLATNPGLESRFSTTITFEDYTDVELRDIFERLATNADFEPTEECLRRFEEIASLQPRTEGFGNGRYARNVLDGAIARHAWRLKDTAEPTLAELRLLLPEDLLAPEAPTDDAQPVELFTTDTAPTEEHA